MKLVSIAMVSQKIVLGDINYCLKLLKMEGWLKEYICIWCFLVPLPHFYISVQ